MDPSLTSLMDELYNFGREHDATTQEHSRRMRNILPETGQFLLLLIRAVHARQVLELGTSNGYSTLWLASAVQPLFGHVVTLEQDPDKIRMARENFTRAGSTGSLIELREGDARKTLADLPAGSFDLIFMDTDRSLYVSMWAALQALLKPSSLFVVDNAISHESELADFVSLVRSTPGYLTSLNPVGKGELLILKPGYAPI